MTPISDAHVCPCTRQSCAISPWNIRFSQRHGVIFGGTLVAPNYLKDRCIALTIFLLNYLYRKVKGAHVSCDYFGT